MKKAPFEERVDHLEALLPQYADPVQKQVRIKLTTVEAYVRIIQENKPFVALGVPSAQEKTADAYKAAGALVQECSLIFGAAKKVQPGRVKHTRQTGSAALVGT